MIKDSHRIEISEVYNKAVINHSNGNLAAKRFNEYACERKRSNIFSISLNFIIDNNLKVESRLIHYLK